jgi:hypothetical protein
VFASTWSAHFQKNSNPFSLAALNIVELVINALYLYSTYVLDSPVAPLFGFSTNLMTLSKTVLYIAHEYFCGFCNIGHNTAKDLFFFYICPNGWARHGIPLRRSAYLCS